MALKRCKHFELGGDKKRKVTKSTCTCVVSKIYCKVAVENVYNFYFWVTLFSRLRLAWLKGYIMCFKKSVKNHTGLAFFPHHFHLSLLNTPFQ